MAFLSIIIAVGTLTMGGMAGRAFVQWANLVVSPNMDGGKIIKTLHNDGYRVAVHAPVFQGLFKPKKEGFIQVDFFKDKDVPDLIREMIDFDEDNRIDFTITYHTDTNKVELESHHPDVSTRFLGIKRKSGYTVRIDLTNSMV